RFTSLFVARMICHLAQASPPGLFEAPVRGRAEQMLVDALKAEDSDIHLWGCMLLCEFSPPRRAIPVLRRLVSSDSVPVRVAAAAALADTLGSTQRSIVILREGSDSDEPIVAALAAAALLRLGLHQPGSHQALVHLLTEGDPVCRYFAISALKPL